ncbi:hypothetical protein QE152_g34450 [Popillia japonica]|uniref:Uncharacterized protein n=1 Tax=Popillia japonica TaxID=7064 RepID=A0AAW1ISW7_POPJA
MNLEVAYKLGLCHNRAHYSVFTDDGAIPTRLKGTNTQTFLNDQQQQRDSLTWTLSGDDFLSTAPMGDRDTPNQRAPGLPRTRRLPECSQAAKPNTPSGGGGTYLGHPVLAEGLVPRVKKMDGVTPNAGSTTARRSPTLTAGRMGNKPIRA